MNCSSDRLLEAKCTELPDELAAHVYGGAVSKIPGVHKVSDVTLKRGIIGTNYFDGKLLTADDLRNEQNF